MNNTTICIIDDNEAVTDALAFLFESFLNVKAKIYNNPLNFLDEVSPEWEGCLLMDLFMPSMNGVDLLKEFKKINPFAKVIIMSGHAANDVAEQSRNAGAYAFISKPFNSHYLLDQVRQILEYN